MPFLGFLAAIMLFYWLFVNEILLIPQNLQINASHNVSDAPAVRLPKNA
jgi:hypothetical protein